MVSEAYEKNFRGMASAIDNTNHQLADTKKTMQDLHRQHVDMVKRVILLEQQVQKLQAKRD